MVATRKALILSTVLHAGTMAWADTATPANSRKIEPPKAVTASPPRINYFDLRLPSTREMEAPQSSASIPSSSHQAIGVKNEVDALNLGQSNRLHLTLGEHRPGFEYHLSDKTTVRFHINVHGANASTSWGF